MVAPDGAFATTAEDMARVLRAHWQGVFADKPVDRAELLQWAGRAARHASGVDAREDEWRVEEAHILQAILHSNDSSPGPDGIPYLAWRLLHPTAVPILTRVLEAMATGDLATQRVDAPGFNASTLCCLPKSSDLETPDGVPTYQTANTRHLSVGNTDNRILAGACRYAWEGAVSRRAHPHQHGFLRHRSMVQNVFDIKEGMRTFAC
jgi:hypothetical protein